MYNYFICDNNTLVAENHKAASSSVSKALLKKFYPDKSDNLSENAPFFAYGSFLPATNVCLDKDVYVLYRDPVERFVSLVSFMNLDSNRIDLLLSQMPSILNPSLIPSYQTPHGHIGLQPFFYPQSGFGKGCKNLYRFKFPDQIEEFCDALELEYPLETINKNDNKKIELTEQQLNIIYNIYNEDINIYNSL